jgi:uncharacterized protein (DUF58 family)
MPAALDEEFLRKLELLRLAVRKLATVRREGDRPARRPGHSSDLLTQRPYAQGDEFRHIDWAAYARLEEIFVRQFAREETISLEVVIDSSASMRFGRPPKLELAARLAAAFGYVTLANRGRVSVHTPAGSGLSSRTFDGPAAHRELISHASNLSAGAPMRLALLHDLRPAPGRRPFVVALTDLWFDVGAAELRSLRGRFGQIAFVQILAPEELEPGEEGKVLLADSETGEVRETYLDEEARREYRERMEEHLRRLEGLLESQEVAYARLRSDTPLDRAFFVTIREAGLVV